MEQYFERLSRCQLFHGIEPEHMSDMLSCLGGKVVSITKGSTLFLEGDPARYVGIVLEGMVQIVRDDYYGNRSILAVVSPGELFAEVFSCAGLDTMPVSVVALTSGSVLLMDCKRMLQSCPNTCPFHSRLISNLLRGMARKNLMLTQKIRHMTQRTTRDKLMEFLLDQAKQNKSSEFVIPYDRQALADYLGVERSAMSAEIGKMRREGLIESNGSKFRLLSPPPALH